MRWVTAVDGCFSNASIVGAGNARRAEAPRQDGVGIPARGSGAVCPSRRVDSRRLVLQRVAERWTGQNTKFWGRPQDIDAGSQLCEQRVVCAHCCVCEPV